MRVLICGSRDWDDEHAIDVVLGGIEYAGDSTGLPTIIHGAARGADSLAGRIARDCNYPEVAYLAEWDVHGKAAGPIRNQRMLDEGKPEVVWAFTDDLANSRGTADMVRRARKAGIPVYVVSRA